MRHVAVRLSSAVLAALAGLVLAACGESERAAAPAPASPSAQRAAVVPERTDGRLGDATTQTAGGVRTLDRGGRIKAGAGAPPRGVREGVDGAASCGAVDAQPSAESLSGVFAATVCLLNLERTSRGLVALRTNERLTQAAAAHAGDMVSRKYFAHEAPSGSSPADRIKATGYIPSDASWTVGENLAWGTGALATPAAIVRAWMASPGHRENLLKPDYRELGLAIVLGVPKAGLDGGATYANTFGAITGGDVEPVSTGTSAAPGGTATAGTAAATAGTKVGKASTRKPARSAKARATAKARAAKARAAKARAKARAAKARAARARARAAKARAARARARAARSR